MRSILRSRFFFFNDTATTEIYTLSLHDALPICGQRPALPGRRDRPRRGARASGSRAAPAADHRLGADDQQPGLHVDRKSTRLNSSHGYISYAVFCLKKKTDKYLASVAAVPRFPD